MSSCSVAARRVTDAIALSISARFMVSLIFAMVFGPF